jgi:hypothetical protein
MNIFKRIFLPIIFTGIWINLSETVRWIFLIKSYWINHYRAMNLVFPNNPTNGIIWLIWGFLFAVILFVLSKKFNLLQTTFFSWFTIFAMLWIVLLNIDVLPVGILFYVIPMSLFETYVGALICRKFLRQESREESA